MHAVERPIWSIRPPEPETVRAFLRQQEGRAFSYAEVGATRTEAPPGYYFDHNRVLIGHGDEAFARAREAIRTWKMFPRPWTKIVPSEASIVSSQGLAMQAYAMGVWWLNACRIVYVIDQAVPRRRFGFAYGTLAAHVEQGEECFSVEQLANGEVWYDLRAFSRPRYWPVRLAKPLARRLQRRFVRESQRAMKQAVANEEYI